jgi:hypothetical protein
MKRLLLPLLAAIALPTAVSAETYSLMVMESKSQSSKPGVFAVITNITFSTYDECVAEGEKFKEKNKTWYRYHCFKGQ